MISLPNANIKDIIMTQKLLLTSLSALAFVIGGLVVTPEAKAAACDIEVDATDSMTFSTKAIEVPKSCKEFTVNLKHSGKLAKNIMGHNLVIAKEADQKGILDDGSAAGAAGDFLKKDDPRVIAATHLIGAGETSSAKFAVSKLSAKDNYVFFCSFPGHAMMMKGTVKVN